MAKLIQQHTGKSIEVPDDQVAHAYLSGQYGLPKGKEIPVISPDGEPGYVPLDQAADAFKAGYAYDEKGVKDAEIQKKYGGVGEQIKAGAEGLASGLTFGLSRLAERGMGIDPEAMKGRQQANPVTSVGSEIAGAVIPSIISEVATAGGATPGIAANAARIAAGPMGLITKGASAVGKGVASVLPTGTGMLTSLAARSLPGIAEAATTGAAFGAGNFISEAALHTKGDPELTAEHALASVGMGALLGGSLKVGTDLLGSGAKALMPKSMPKGIGPQELEDFAAERTTKAIAGGKLKYTKQVDKWHGGPVEFGKALEDLGLGKVGVSPEANLDLAQTAMNHYGPQLGKAYQDLDSLVNQNPNLAALLPETKPLFANLEKNFIGSMKGQPSLDAARKKLEEMLPRWQEEFGQGPRMSFADLWAMQKDIGDVVNWADVTQKPFNKAAGELRNIVKGIISDSASDTTKMAGLPDAAQAIAGLNKNYATAARAAEILKDKVSSGEANRTFSLTDHFFGLGAGMAGLAHGNPLGALASIPGMIANKLMRSQGNQVLAATASGLASMQRKLSINAQRIATGVGNFIGGLEKAAIPAIERNFYSDLGSPQAAYDERMKELDDALKNPGKMVDNLEQSTRAISDIAPETTKIMQTKATQAAQFLQAKAPKNPGEVSPLFTGQWKPTDSQIAGWARYWDAVQDPLSVIDALSSGTVSKEGIETLKTVYPKLYMDAQQQVLQALVQAHADGKSQLTYQQQLQLSMFLGTPVSPLLTPQFIAFAQSQYTQPQGEQDQTGGALHSSAAAKNGMPGRHQTGTQALLTRRANS